MNLNIAHIDDLKLSKSAIFSSWEKMETCEKYFQTKLFCDYYQIYFGADYQLSLLAIVSPNHDYIYGIVPYTFNPAQNKISYFNHPVDVIWFQDMKAESNIYNLVLHKLKMIFDEMCTFKFDEKFEVGQYFERQSEFCAMVDLKLSEEEIYRQVRKSYRSLINWGKREMEIEVYESKNADYQKFEKFREFHIKVSGRETRSKLSWDKQFEMIERNQAYLVLGYYQKNLVSGSLNFFSRNECFYGVGVNDRELMEQKCAVGHWTIMKSILLAKEFGILHYNLGLVGPDAVFDNVKEKNIALFKSGFSERRVEYGFLSNRSKL